MSDSGFYFFLLSALIVAVVPGPGIFYVVGRTLSAGRRAGLASIAGTAAGGMLHVIAIAIGVSAIVLASARLFVGLKYAGAIYLVWLGLRTFRDAGRLPIETAHSGTGKRAFLEGVAVEALNPKTAAFFLAFIPQFLDPATANPALRFVELGLISVIFNSTADIVAVLAASATCLRPRPLFFGACARARGC